MNGHLGDRVAAYVDGQLDYPAREKALQHLGGCVECRAAVEQERWVKSRVQTLPGAEPSAALLMALTRTSGQPAGPGSAPLDPAGPDWHRHGAGRHWRFPTSRRGRGGLLLASASSVSAGVLGLAYVVGGTTTVAQPAPVSPPVDQFSAQFAGSERPMPFADPATDAFPVISHRAPSGGW